MSHLHPHSASERITAENFLQVFPNSPNPFFEMTMLRFKLPAPSEVLIRIFDSKGREIAEKIGSFTTGEHHMVLQRQELAGPGQYSYQVETAFGIGRRKLMLF